MHTQLQATDLRSIYTQRPSDPEAFYFTPEFFNVVADGKTDVSDVLQGAINKLKKEKNFGILFIPEGKYKISKTIYIPNAIRYIYCFTDFVVKPGDNNHDFEVTPYLRVKNTKIVYDESNQKVTATFSVEGGKPEVKLSELRLFAFTDQYVGNNVKFDLKNTVSKFLIRNPTPVVIDNTVFTLTIDLNENKDFFKFERNYYFRVGALGNVANVGTVRHNYSPLISFKVKL